MAAIGFTLPYLPLYLGEKGLSDRAIEAPLSTLAAPLGAGPVPGREYGRSDRMYQPFWSSRSAVTAVSTILLREAHGLLWMGFLVVLFAENGICRAVVESLSGAEAAALAPTGGVGAALGALRFWKPIGIVMVALVGSRMAERYGVGAILVPLAVVQGLLAVAAAALIHEDARPRSGRTSPSEMSLRRCSARGDLKFPKDGGLGLQVVATGWSAVACAGCPGDARLCSCQRDLLRQTACSRPQFAGDADRLDVCRLAGRPPWPKPPRAQPLLMLELGDHVAQPGSWPWSTTVEQPSARTRPRRPGQRPLRRRGGRPPDGRAPGQTETVGRGPGDRRLVPGPRLGGNGVGVPGRPARCRGLFAALAALGALATAVVIAWTPRPAGMPRAERLETRSATMEGARRPRDRLMPILSVFAQVSASRNRDLSGFFRDPRPWAIPGFDLFDDLRSLAYLALAISRSPACGSTRRASPGRRDARRRRARCDAAEHQTADHRLARHDGRGNARPPHGRVLLAGDGTDRRPSSPGPVTATLAVTVDLGVALRVPGQRRRLRRSDAPWSPALPGGWAAADKSVSLNHDLATASGCRLGRDDHGEPGNIIGSLSHISYLRFAARWPWP